MGHDVITNRIITCFNHTECLCIKNSPFTDCAPKCNEINKVVIYEYANKIVDKILLFMHSTFALFPHTAVSSKGWLQWRSFIAHTSNPAPIIYINWLWCIYLCNPGMIGWGLSHHAPQILPFCVYLLKKRGKWWLGTEQRLWWVLLMLRPLTTPFDKFSILKRTC